MTERGKYHGQRLSSQEVQRLYAAGERNFRGVVLHGCDFQEQDLSGADFSRADIRGADFTDSILVGTNFSKVKSGATKQLCILKEASCVWFIAMFSAALTIFKDSYFEGCLNPDYVSHLSELVSATILLTSFVISIILLKTGFSTEITTKVSILGVGISASFITLFGVDRVLAFLILIGLLLGICSGIFLSTSIPLFGIFALSVLILVAAILSIGVTFCIVAVGRILNFFIYREFRNDVFLGIGDDLGLLCALLTLLLAYVLLCVQLRSKDFEWIEKVIKAFSVSIGTSFRGACLSNANFSEADISYTDFVNSNKCKTVLFQVWFKHVKGIHYARFEKGLLSKRKVRDLLVTLDGVEQNFSGVDLSGLNLAGARLNRASLRGSILKCTNFQFAELYEAIFTETNCIGADFTGAHLTGACLETWNIDSTTILKDVDCQHVFLREQPDARGDRERRPYNSNKDFEPGDFEKFFKEMLDTVQLLIRNGIHPDSFKSAFQSIMAAHPDITPDSIQGYERRGNDVLVTVQVPKGADKGEIERIWDEVYEARLQAATTAAQLEVEKRRGDDIKEISLGFSRFLSSIQINNMNNPINTGDGSFFAGGDVNLSGSTLNLGHISGQVTNQINQVPDSAASNQPSIKDILMQLQTAIEADAELSNEEKAEALQAVGRLATAAAEPAPTEKTRGIAKRAAATLKGMAETVTDASKLAEACKQLLPVLLSLLALV